MRDDIYAVMAIVLIAIIQVPIIWWGYRHKQRHLDQDADYQVRKSRNEQEAAHLSGLRRKIKLWLGI